MIGFEGNLIFYSKYPLSREGGFRCTPSKGACLF